MDYWVRDLPLPPSINRAYRNVPKIGRVKTSIYRAFEKEMALRVVKKLKIDGPLALYLYFYFEKSQVWTKDDRIKKLDLDNRIKCSVDSLTKAIGIDDSTLFEVHAFKCISTRPRVDALITNRSFDTPVV